MKVIEIFKNDAILNKFLEETEGEITPEIEELMDDLAKDVEGKISTILPAINELRGIALSKKEYADKIKEASKSIDKKADALVKLVDNLMQISGKEKLVLTEGTVSYRKSTSLIVENEEKVPLEFFNIKEVRSLDKTSIKKALKNREVDGVYLQEKKNIQIGG